MARSLVTSELDVEVSGTVPGALAFGGTSAANADVVAALADMLGGVFYHDRTATEDADGRDFVARPLGGGKLRRVPLKWTLTTQVTITAGATVTLFDAANFPRATLLAEIVSADAANRVAGEVVMGNADPLTTDDITIHTDPAVGSIAFEAGDTGTNVQVTSTLEDDTVFDITLGRLR